MATTTNITTALAKSYKTYDNAWQPLFNLWPTAKTEFEQLLQTIDFEIDDDIIPYPELGDSVHLSTSTHIFYITFVTMDAFYDTVNDDQMDIQHKATIYIGCQTLEDADNGEPFDGLALAFKDALSNNNIITF